MIDYFVIAAHMLTLSFALQLIFSKCLSGMWPHYDAIAMRCMLIKQALADDPNCDLTQFQTSGKVKAQSRKKKSVEDTKLPAHMQSSQSQKMAAAAPKQEEPVSAEPPAEIQAAPEEVPEPKEEPKPVLKEEEPAAPKEEAKPAVEA